MKNGNPCPKCGNRRVARVPFKNINQSDYVSLGFMGMHNVNLERWICMTCGFSEDWAESTVGLGALEAYEVRWS